MKLKEKEDALTLNDYITSQINNVRNKALNKSKTRLYPRVPMDGKRLNETEWETQINNNIAKLQKDLQNPYLWGTGRNAKMGELLYLEHEKSKGYDAYRGNGNPIGPSCAATTFDNYGMDIIGSELFRRIYKDRGFKKIDNSLASPSDVIIDVENGRGTHTMMLNSGSTKDNNLRFNHSNGGYEPENIRKNAKYPFKGEMESYTYVGTPADSVRWTKEYNLKYRISRKLLGGSLTNNDKEILWKLNEHFGANSSKDKYFKYWNFLNLNSDANEYFNSYISSPGVKRILNNQNTWWEKRHPYRKYYSNPDKGTKKWLETASKTNPMFYNADMYSDLSAVYTIPKAKQRIGVVGKRDSSEFPLNFVIGHEYAHGKSPFSLFGDAPFHTESALKEALNLNRNTKKNRHDERSNEKHADNWGLKYLLYKEGIYDARGKKDITTELVKLLREKYPELRPFKQMNDEQIKFQLNNVASIKPNNKLA